jgi:hypothetical protein
MRMPFILLLSIIFAPCNYLHGADRPEEAASIAKILELGGQIRRANGRPEDAKGETPVVSVNFVRNNQLKDEDLRCFKPLGSLRQLYLGQTAISDSGLKHVGELTGLTSPGLGGTTIGDAGLKQLGGLQNLQQLLISDTAVTDAGLCELARLHNLEYLMLGGTAISDLGLKSLEKIPSLMGLELGGTKITDAGLKELAKLPRLTKLWLSQNQVSDAGLTHLSQIPGLTVLDLSETKVSDVGLRELAKIRHLERLDLSQTNVTDAGLKSLRALKELRMLLVAKTKVTEAGVKDFQGLWSHTRVLRQSQGQRSDPNFDVSVVHPAYTDRHPAVLFDEAHQNFHTAGGRYKVFADLITNDGYRVTPNKAPFTKDSLAKYQLLVTANAPGRPGASKSAFTQEECDCVQEWVRNGGGLLIITDHEPFGSGSEELGKRFGVQMSLLVTTDPPNEKIGLLFSREKKLIGDHAIMKGRDSSERVDRVLTFVGQSLKGPPGSVPLLIFSDTAFEMHQNKSVSAAGRAQGVALKYGKGRVVVMGEAGDLSAQVYGDPPQPMGMNVPGCDNRKFALNIVHWLSGLID